MAVVAESVAGGRGQGEGSTGAVDAGKCLVSHTGAQAAWQGFKGEGRREQAAWLQGRAGFQAEGRVSGSPEERKQATAGPRNDVPEGHLRELDRLLKENTEEGGPLFNSQQSYAGVRGDKCGHLDLGAQDQVKSCKGGRFQVSVRKLSNADPGGVAVPRGSESPMLGAAGCWGR